MKKNREVRICANEGSGGYNVQFMADGGCHTTKDFRLLSDTQTDILNWLNDGKSPYSE